jgi:hypothetical protein
LRHTTVKATLLLRLGDTPTEHIAPIAPQTFNDQHIELHRTT